MRSPTHVVNQREDEEREEEQGGKEAKEDDGKKEAGEEEGREDGSDGEEERDSAELKRKAVELDELILENQAKIASLRVSGFDIYVVFCVSSHNPNMNTLHFYRHLSKASHFSTKLNSIAGPKQSRYCAIYATRCSLRLIHSLPLH